DFLDLVLAPEPRKPLLHLFKRVSSTDGFNGFFFGMLLAVAMAGIGGRGFRFPRALPGSGRLFALGRPLEKRRAYLGRWSDGFTGGNFSCFARLLFGD